MTNRLYPMRLRATEELPNPDLTSIKRAHVHLVMPEAMMLKSFPSTQCSRAKFSLTSRVVLLAIKSLT